MKKLVSLISLFGAVACSFGQGQIAWNNSATTLIRTGVGIGGPPAVPPGTSLPANNPTGSNPFFFGIFMAPQGTPAPLSPLDPSWQYVAGYGANSTAATGAGRMQNPGNASSSVYNSGSTVNFIVRGWSANLGGMDWAQVLLNLPGMTQNYYLGTSALAVNAILGGGPLPVPSAWGLGANQIGGLNLDYYVIPEPTTLALAGLGAAGLLIFRRRK